MRTEMDTSEFDGHACDECGEDAVTTALLKTSEGRIDTALCGTCHTHLTTVCPRCENRIWQADGYRTCGTPDLYCPDCNGEIERALLATALPEITDEAQRRR